MSSGVRHDDIVAYYTECWAGRLRAGHNPRSHAIHYGLDATDDDAKLRTNAHLLERLALDEGAPLSLVDLGCGVGGTILDLARTRPAWRFTGIDATHASLEVARELARASGISDRARFIEADYAAPLAQTFDAAYAVESLCHAADRDAVARAAHRALHPGAPFVVVDLFRTSSALDSNARERYEALRRGFVIADYYDEALEAVLARAGFSEVTSVDLTERAAPSLARSAERARAELSASSLSERQQSHLHACVAASALLSTGHLKYRSIRAARNIG